jgi:hypothetical protein
MAYILVILKKKNSYQNLRIFLFNKNLKFLDFPIFFPKRQNGGPINQISPHNIKYQKVFIIIIYLI